MRKTSAFCGGHGTPSLRSDRRYLAKASTYLVLILFLSGMFFGLGACAQEQDNYAALREEVVGGDLAGRRFPAVGALFVDWGDGWASSQCTAFLVSSDTLYSATHCVEYAQRARGKVAVGDRNLLVYFGERPPGKWLRFRAGGLPKENRSDPHFIAWRRAKRVHRMPGYTNGLQYAKDIAVIQLAEAIPNDVIQPIAVNRDNLDLPPLDAEHNFVVAGFGASSAAGYDDEFVKRSAPARRIAIAEVAAISDYYHHPNAFHTWGAGDPYGTVCYGDSGGALLRYANGRLQALGVASGLLLPRGERHLRCGDRTINGWTRLDDPDVRAFLDSVGGP